MGNLFLNLCNFYKNAVSINFYKKYRFFSLKKYTNICVKFIIQIITRKLLFT